MSALDNVWGWIRGTLGVSPPREPNISEPLARALLAQKQQAVDANRRVLSDLADTLAPAERQQIAHLLDDRRFLEARHVD